MLEKKTNNRAVYVICDNGFGFMENCVIDYETRLKNVFVDS